MGKRNPKAQSIVKCRECGIDVVQQFPLSWPRKFCSRKCYADYQRTLPKDSFTLKLGHLGSIGRKNGSWKGDRAGYTAKHAWVERHYGRPLECEKCNRSDKGYRLFQWANLSGKYLRERSDWMRLCRNCHFRYDAKRRKNERRKTVPSTR